MVGALVIIVIIVCGIAKFVDQEKREYNIINKANQNGQETYIDGRGRRRRTSDNRQFMVKKMPNGHTCWVDPYTNEVLKDVTAINVANKEAKDMEGYEKRKQEAIEKGERFFLYKGYNAYSRNVKQYPYEDITTGKRYVPYCGFMVNVDTGKCEMRCGKYADSFFDKPEQTQFIMKRREYLNKTINSSRHKVTGELVLSFHDGDNRILDGNTLKY